MDKVLNLYKKRGETPLECIHRFKMTHAEYASLPMTYAGRLDPLAEGVLVVLAGEKVYLKEDFLALPKEYEVEVLFGIGTDTYDVLGVPSDISNEVVDISWAEEKLKDFEGRQGLEYPPYSSKPVNGKPLFMYARSNEISSIEMPKKEVEIYSVECESWKKANAKEILEQAQYLINKVKGDFRQEVSILGWQKILENRNGDFYIARIRVESSSGAYMRSLAHRWGEALDVPSLAYKIVRTKVGGFKIEDSIK